MPIDRADNGLAQLVQEACSLGAGAAKIISSEHIVVEDALAEHCADPRCPGFGASRSCPPHVDGPDYFRKLQKTHRQALVLRLIVPSAALFSEERKGIFALLHEIVASVEQTAVRMGYAEAQGFAGGSCKQIFCHDRRECRVVSNKGECRHPHLARPSMSGFGINIARLIKSCGWPATIADEAAAGPQAMSWVAGLIMLG